MSYDSCFKHWCKPNTHNHTASRDNNAYPDITSGCHTHADEDTDPYTHNSMCVKELFMYNRKSL